MHKERDVDAIKKSTTQSDLVRGQTEFALLASMLRLKTLFYYLGLAALFTHELDAVINAEWRLLFHLRTLPDPAASTLFVALHLPLFVGFFYLGHHRKDKVREAFRALVAVFLMVHSALHFNLSDHPHYQFEGLLSKAYIYGAGLFGLAYIMLAWIRHRD